MNERKRAPEVVSSGALFDKSNIEVNVSNRKVLKRCLHMSKRTERAVALADLIIGDVQIGFLCDGDAGMAQQTTQCVDVHPAHQTAFGKVVSQTVRRVAFAQTSTAQVFFEIGFKVRYAYMPIAALNGEEVVAFYIAVFELQPAAEYHFCFRGKEDSAAFSPFGDLGLKEYAPICKFKILDGQAGTLAQAHTTI